jgi:hypothetical protein
MCEKCVELDGKIEHYRQISRWVNDRTTLEGIATSLQSMRRTKKRFIPRVVRSPPSPRLIGRRAFPKTSASPGLRGNRDRSRTFAPLAASRNAELGSRCR